MFTQIQNRHILRWWTSLVFTQSELTQMDKSCRAAPSGYKAQMKRVESIDAVLMQEAFQMLWMEMPEQEKLTPTNVECLAVIAAALSYVVPGCEDSLGIAAGKKGASKDKSVVSKQRFAKLTAARTPEEFLRVLRRLLKLIQGKTDPMKLLKDIEQWFVEYQNDHSIATKNRLAVRWAMDYYRAAN